MRFALCLAVLFLMAGPVSPAFPQKCDGPCTIDGPDGGTYEVLEPDGWDGVTTLPVLIWYHGWQRTGKYVLRNKRTGGVTRKKGVLLIAPNGVGKSWSMPVWKGRDGRDDLAFTRRLLTDVKRRWPIDENRVWIAGFSLGGSMAWYVACEMGSLADAFFPVSGVFWRPHPEACPDPARRLSHVHGTADTVMPLDGRSFDDGARQGNVFQSVAVMRAAQGFGVEPDRHIRDGIRDCDIWENAETGQSLELCLHPTGHNIPDDWVARSIDKANRRAGFVQAAGQEDGG
ncbi:MAG: hypothetical protein RIM72_14050 [Alphaproteobacteria bacterium]